MIDPEVLEMAEELGSAQMPPDEACICLGIQEEELSGDIATAYLKGQLHAKFVVQLSVFEMAKQGSAPAQKQFLQLASIASSFELEPETEE